MEMVFDVIMIILWLVATTQLASYATCPAQSVTLSTVLDIIDNSTRYCPTLVTTITGGYISCFFFIWKLYDGFKVERDFDLKGQNVENTMFARGNWNPQQ